MDSVTNCAVQTVREYLLALNTIALWQGYSFEQLSYAGWAAKELLKRLEEGKSAPLLTMERFRDQMARYSSLNPNSGFLFETACQTADNIIDRMLS